MADMLGPGFRFHPTDDELVSYYLKRKICGQRFKFDAISEIDVYKLEPWDLPGLSKLQSRDLEWYFFSGLDKKYGNGIRTNRATEQGYWKTTGKDREVYHNAQVVGMKKTLVYHFGRAPRGQRTNWVMHEYKIMDNVLANTCISQIEKDAFVLCRIFQKSGPGPKNGERYGAPLIEDEWEKDELVLAPGIEVVEKAVISADSAVYHDSSDLQQVPVGDVPPLCFYNGETKSQVQETPVEACCLPLEQEQLNHYSSAIQMQNQMDVKPANQEVSGEPSYSLSDLDFWFDDPFFDAPFFDAVPDGIFDDDLPFLETDDLLNSIDGKPGGDMVEEYLNNQQGSQFSFIQKASDMLGGISAPPAFASEFPTRESALHPASASCSSVHLTAGLFQIQKQGLNGTQSSWTNGKNVGVSLVFSLGLSRNNGDNSPSVSDVLSKVISAVSRSFMYLMFFWVTYKIGSLFCSGNGSS